MVATCPECGVQIGPDGNAAIALTPDHTDMRYRFVVRCGYCDHHLCMARRWQTDDSPSHAEVRQRVIEYFDGV